MGLRLYSEFKSSNDKQYKVEIYDDTFSGTSTSFVVDGSGFTLDYQGQTDDIVSPIIGSSCTINAYNENSVFDAFVTALFTSQEDRFYMKVLLHDGSGYENYWSGIILQDLVSEFDESKPRLVSIVATDGIGHLAHKDFISSDDVTIEAFIESAVDALGFDEMYASTDAFYATTLNVWDTNITYDATADVSTLIRFDSSVYATREEDGTFVYTNYLEILKELCVAFGARFYQQDGVFHFEQYLERVASSRTVTKYQFDGTKISTASVSDDITLDQTTSGGARMGGNSFNYLPALQKVQVSFDQERAHNLLATMVHFTSITGRKSIGFVPDNDNARLQLDLNLSYQLTLNTTPPSVALEFYRPVWDIEIRIEDINNPGTYYYLKRDWTPGTLGAQLYGPTSWTTTASVYQVDAGLAKTAASGLYLSGPTSLVTPPLPVSGTCEIDINFDDTYDSPFNNNVPQSVPSYFDEHITSIAKKVMFINDTGALDTVQVFASTNTDTDIKSNLTLDLGTLRVSDAVGLAGSFFVYNGLTFVRSTVWRRGNSGTYINLYKLLTKEVLSLHKQPIERYDGTIISSSNFGQRFVFDSKDWLMLRGKYNANMDEWSGEWFAIEKDETNITTEDPVGSGGISTETARVSSQQGTDEIINTVGVLTTTSEVTGNQTIGGTLGVTGASTLDATSVGAFTTTKQVSVTINTITGNPGGSETLTLDDHFNFVSYSGANGTYTVTLPNADSGAIMRFKTDDSILANKTITLQPQSGQRIDGEATYLMDRSYDGISIVGHNDNWYVIQKKEK